MYALGELLRGFCLPSAHCGAEKRSAAFLAVVGDVNEGFKVIGVAELRSIVYGIIVHRYIFRNLFRLLALCVGVAVGGFAVKHLIEKERFLIVRKPLNAAYAACDFLPFCRRYCGFVKRACSVTVRVNDKHVIRFFAYNRGGIGLFTHLQKPVFAAYGENFKALVRYVIAFAVYVVFGVKARAEHAAHAAVKLHFLVLQLFEIFCVKVALHNLAVKVLYKHCLFSVL